MTLTDESVVPHHVFDAMVDAKDRRIQDLLEANARYVERARRAEEKAQNRYVTVLSKARSTHGPDVEVCLIPLGDRS